MKNIQSAKVEKMAKSGSLVTMWKKKIKNRLKPFIFTNWTILSDLEQKNIFDFWIIQNFQIPNLKILDDPDFSRKNRLARFLPL